MYIRDRFGYHQSIYYIYKSALDSNKKPFFRDYKYSCAWLVLDLLDLLYHELFPPFFYAMKREMFLHFINNYIILMKIFKKVVLNIFSPVKNIIYILLKIFQHIEKFFF